jgi:hypothetical protein
MHQCAVAVVDEGVLVVAKARGSELVEESDSELESSVPPTVTGNLGGAGGLGECVPMFEAVGIELEAIDHAADCGQDLVALGRADERRDCVSAIVRAISPNATVPWNVFGAGHT